MSSHIACPLSALATKVDEIAQRAGVPADARSDLETTLAALPWRDRRRLGLVLESARVSASSDAVRVAVDMMLGLAADIWTRTSPPDERDDGSAPA